MRNLGPVLRQDLSGGFWHLDDGWKDLQAIGVTAFRIGIATQPLI